MEQQSSRSIQVSFPAGEALQLRIAMGPAQLRIAPGAGAGDWVTGTYQDPTGGIPLKVEQEGTTVRIHQKVGPRNIPRPRGNPVLDLHLGADRPYALVIEGGAAAFKLDFGGPLQRDCRVRVNVGAAGLEIDVPGATAARIKVKTTLGGVDVGDGFQTKEGGYWTPPAVAGQGPLLTIDGTVALAGLKLRGS